MRLNLEKINNEESKLNLGPAMTQLLEQENLEQLNALERLKTESIAA